jgi:hypothetical protein
MVRAAGLMKRVSMLLSRIGLPSLTDSPLLRQRPVFPGRRCKLMASEEVSLAGMAVATPADVYSGPLSKWSMISTRGAIVDGGRVVADMSGGVHYTTFAVGGSGWRDPGALAPNLHVP